MNDMEEVCALLREQNKNLELIADRVDRIDGNTVPEPQTQSPWWLKLLAIPFGLSIWVVFMGLNAFIFSLFD